MIERLMNLERPYGEPEYSRLSEQITQLKQTLIVQLDQEQPRATNRCLLTSRKRCAARRLCGWLLVSGRIDDGISAKEITKIAAYTQNAV